MNWIENWVFNVYGGKLVARGAALASGWIIAHALPVIAAKAGVPLPFTPDQITAGMLSLSMFLFETIKKARMANPASPAVQTDARLPGSDIPAIASVAAANATTAKP